MADLMDALLRAYVEGFHDGRLTDQEWAAKRANWGDEEDRRIVSAVARVVLQEAERAAWGTPTEDGRYRSDPGRPGDWSSTPEPGSYGDGRRDAAERIRTMLEEKIDG